MANQNGNTGRGGGNLNSRNRGRGGLVYSVPRSTPSSSGNGSQPSTSATNAQLRTGNQWSNPVQPVVGSPKFPGTRPTRQDTPPSAINFGASRGMTYNVNTVSSYRGTLSPKPQRRQEKVATDRLSYSKSEFNLLSNLMGQADKYDSEPEEGNLHGSQLFTSQSANTEVKRLEMHDDYVILSFLDNTIIKVSISKFFKDIENISASSLLTVDSKVKQSFEAYHQGGEKWMKFLQQTTTLVIYGSLDKALITHVLCATAPFVFQALTLRPHAAVEMELSDLYTLIPGQVRHLIIDASQFLNGKFVDAALGISDVLHRRNPFIPCSRVSIITKGFPEYIVLWRILEGLVEVTTNEASINFMIVDPPCSAWVRILIDAGFTYAYTTRQHNGHVFDMYYVHGDAYITIGFRRPPE